MYILGLTGSIGMGKTWGTKCFRRLGVAVHDADACVHRLMAPNGKATAQVAKAFPGVMNDQGAIDRQKLGAWVLNDTPALDKLQAMLHPLVRQNQRKFLAQCQRRGAPLVVLDIPLLFETHARSRVDSVVVMSAPASVQRQRVLRRPGMSPAKFEAILARQVPDEVKRQLAEHLVFTGATRGQSLRQIAKIVKVTKTKKGHAWSPHWLMS
ncbi:dephospho-CoA kinase [Magnetovibrio blakemorei]|uniref:Dephospho-CoA kinase n=1 Tax=Magnetovibrio blakemorei TaxID=28181 RepID=A0A1E5Q4P9_9PROT|nr:dephospho-CoA kinase [Magnetovibrio blakemorei]OEJ64419.1 dephospho-CoA kinase [Magnetovibrio blakemorei]